MNTNEFTSFDNKGYLKFSDPFLIQKDLQLLVGIVSGINSDDEINEKEYQALLQWISSKRDYEHKAPYSSIIGNIREAIEDKVLTKDEADNITWFCNQYINKDGNYNLVTASVRELEGIIHGIISDNVINNKELDFLDSWLESNEVLKNSWPYDELYNVITHIRKDNLVTSEELLMLRDFCKNIVGNNENSNIIESLSMLSNGLYQVDPEIIIPENTFCITGISKKYKRRDIAERIELYGGYVSDNISAKLNYLVICDEKNSCWAFSNYGRKIEQAMKHRKSGLNLVVVHEYDLYDTFRSNHDDSEF